MKNPKTRFSLDDNGQIFCYVTSTNLPADGIYATETGVCYDMAVLAQLLNKDEHIDEAIVGRVPATGECHWVFEGQVVNEVTARDAASTGSMCESVDLRLAEVVEQNDKLRDENERLRNDLQSAQAVIQAMQDSEALTAKTSGFAGGDGVALNAARHPEPNQLHSDEPALVSAASTEQIEIEVQRAMEPQDVTPRGGDDSAS